MNNYDAIIIGAGHNGLTNAAYLAKAGLNVVVLEKNDYIGGAAVSRELHKGWIYSSCSYVCSMMRQALHRDLDLGRHGLLLVPYLGTVNFGDGGERLFAYHDEEAAHLELKRHSPHDADAMHRFQADLTRYAQLIRKTLLRTPPDPTSFRPRDIRELLYLAKQFWALGEKEIYEYVRFFTMSAAEYLEDYFENDIIKAAMASPGIIGTALGVYSPGSSYILLHHVMGDVDGSIGAWGLARGGTNLHVHDQVLESRAVSFNLVDDGLAKLIAFFRCPRPVSEFRRAVLHKIRHPVLSGRRDGWVPRRRYD